MPTAIRQEVRGEATHGTASGMIQLVSDSPEGAGLGAGAVGFGLLPVPVITGIATGFERGAGAAVGGAVGGAVGAVTGFGVTTTGVTGLGVGAGVGAATGFAVGAGVGAGALGGFGPVAGWPVGRHVETERQLDAVTRITTHQDMWQKQPNAMTSRAEEPSTGFSTMTAVISILSPGMPVLATTLLTVPLLGRLCDPPTQLKRTQADGSVVDALGAVGGVGVRPAQVQPAVGLRRHVGRGGEVLRQRRQGARDAGGAVCRTARQGQLEGLGLGLRLSQGQN